MCGNIVLKMVNSVKINRKIIYLTKIGTINCIDKTFVTNNFNYLNRIKFIVKKGGYTFLSLDILYIAKSLIKNGFKGYPNKNLNF